MTEAVVEAATRISPKILFDFLLPSLNNMGSLQPSFCGFQFMLIMRRQRLARAGDAHSGHHLS
jgi:hypothetical protein